jgi:hypothetical protein
MNAAPYMAEHPLLTIAIRAEKRSSPVNLYIHNSEDYIADGSDGSMDILDEFKKYVLTPITSPSTFPTAPSRRWRTSFRSSRPAAPSPTSSA